MKQPVQGTEISRRGMLTAIGATVTAGYASGRTIDSYTSENEQQSETESEPGKTLLQQFEQTYGQNLENTEDFTQLEAQLIGYDQENSGLNPEDLEVLDQQESLQEYGEIKQNFLTEDGQLKNNYITENSDGTRQLNTTAINQEINNLRDKETENMLEVAEWYRRQATSPTPTNSAQNTTNASVFQSETQNTTNTSSVMASGASGAATTNYLSNNTNNTKTKQRNTTGTS